MRKVHCVSGVGFKWLYVLLYLQNDVFYQERSPEQRRAGSLRVHTSDPLKFSALLPHSWDYSALTASLNIYPMFIQVQSHMRETKGK